MTNKEYYHDLRMLEANIESSIAKVTMDVNVFPIVVEKDEVDNIVSIRNDINGGNYEVQIIELKCHSYFVGRDVNDDDNEDTYSVNNIASTYDKIVYLELIENYLNR